MDDISKNNTRARDSAVVGVLVSEGTVLLVKSPAGKDSMLAGKWHLPGGWNNHGEDNISAVVREVLEETELTINKNNKFYSLGIRKDESGRSIEYFYSGDWVGEPKPSSDAEEIGFFKFSELLEVCPGFVISNWPLEVKKILNI